MIKNIVVYDRKVIRGIAYLGNFFVTLIFKKYAVKGISSD